MDHQSWRGGADRRNHAEMPTPVSIRSVACEAWIVVSEWCVVNLLNG